MKLLVTGTGRCGTGYWSRLLTESGVECGHEKVFGLAGRGAGDVDSSWLAVPHLVYMEIEAVIHVIREPLACIRSLLSQRGLFTGELSRYGRYIVDNFSMDVGRSGLCRAVQFWTYWNLTIKETAYKTRFVVSRIEDLDSWEAAYQVMKCAGVDVGMEAVQSAWERVPRDYNSRKLGRVIGVEDVLGTRFGKQMLAMAKEEYGYEVPGYP